jgi:hypothetical protein
MTNVGKSIGREPDSNLVTRAAKYPAPTAQAGNYNYKSVIPDLSDVANIQEALTMYHYGQANYNPTNEISADSIEGWLGHIQHQIDFNASTISGGGETKTTEPTLTPTGQPIPDGYVWVDKDANTSTIYPTLPSAYYSATMPTTWGLADKGRIWVNEATDNSVLNVNSYALLSPVSQTITNTILTSPTINGATVSGTFSGNTTFTGNTNITGRLDLEDVRETVNDGTITANVLTLDYSAGTICYIPVAPTANFTVNVTNAPTDNGKAITIVIMVTQGATGYIPNVLQIAGSAQTIKWLGGTNPTPTSSAGKLDIFNFTIVRRATAWTALGNAALNF